MRCEFRSTIVLLFAFALLSLNGCSEELTAPTAEPAVEVGPVKTLVTATGGVTRYEGVIGGENLYFFYVPEAWNGELVVYAHGFVDAGAPLTEPDKDNVAAIRDRILAQGFAWAYCSYRQNGMAIKDGAWATRSLVQLFPARVKARPRHTWLMGNSLGGLIAVELAETHADEFDGVVTLNGMVGGTKAQLDYVGNVRLLFDLLYGSPLGGSVLEVPQAFDLDLDVILPVVGAVQTDPTGLGVIARLRQTPLPGETPEQLVQSLVTAIAFNFRGIHDVLDRTGGACPIDNADKVYEAVMPGLLPPEVLAMLNAAAPRYDRSLPTELLFDRQYEPTGSLTIPMVAVHNRHDHTVPLLHELIYRERVASAGCAANHELRISERYAHTDFPAAEAAEEAATALSDLRQRVLAGGG